MKKLLLAALMLAVFAAGSARALTSDTFDITVTVAHLEISLWNYDGSLAYTTWEVGTLDYSAIGTMTTLESILVSNESTVTIDLSGWVSTQGSGWTNGGSAGADQYVLYLEGNSSNTVPGAFTHTITSTGTPGDEYDEGIASGNRWAFARFQAPTSTDSASRTITVTILAHTP